MKFSRSSISLLLVVSLLSQCPLSAAVDPVRTIIAEDGHGRAIRLRDDRRPALYTDKFGDCQGASLLNVTRFDAGFYKDNMTVAFHIEGNTVVQQDNIMLYIGVFAYGEKRFELTLDPCLSNIKNLCPVHSAIPIRANGVMPVSRADVSGIPDIAFSIPDFDGQAVLKVFSNTTRSQIGCYSAVVTNGATFSQPLAVGIVLGIFIAIALLSSIAVAIYGTSACSTRKHYAHSLSVFVVFSTLQHIYFTGALSMNWPSVLVAFWSNYAWSAGMIYNENMQNSINQFVGNNRSKEGVGGTLAGSAMETISGGYNALEIYHRDYSPQVPNQAEVLQTRADTYASTSFPWYGSHVEPGLPLPGNYSGFAGTLSSEMIPVSNAFMTGFLWLLILLAIIATSTIVLKGTIEGLCCVNIVETERLAHFRNHWLRYTWMAMARTLFVAFFMLQFLCIFQFTLDGNLGVSAIAGLAFALSFIGMFVASGIAIYSRLRVGLFVVEPDRVIFEKRKVLKVVPWLTFRIERQSEVKDTNSAPSILSLRKIRHINRTSSQLPIHEDEDYLYKFAWLSGRFRRSRWWFFIVWLIYEFIRACLLGAAFIEPISQIIGLFVVDFVALIVIVWMKPFEATRLNALMVYCLGFSKITTVALSSAFDPRFKLERITTTVIGVVIIAIQSILTVLLLIAIVVGAASSYVSITRYRSDEAFKPRSCAPLRVKYLAHVDQRALDLPAATSRDFLNTRRGASGTIF